MSSKATTITIWIFSALLALEFAFAGFTKLSGDPRAVAGFQAMGYPDWFRLFIGAAEAAGGIGLLVPRLRFWAASGLLLIMFGAVYTHVKNGDGPDKMAAALISLVLLAVIAWLTRPRKQLG